MKTLSLKLDEIIFQETEGLLLKIKKPRNRYINEAIEHYNKIQQKKILAKLIEAESKIVRDGSMKVLSEFEKFEVIKRIITLLIVFGINNLFSQSSLIWSNEFNVSNDDYISRFQPKIQVNEDTIKVIGMKKYAGGERLSIVKYDIFGNELSSSIYGNDSVSNNIIMDYKIDTSNHVYILHKEQLGYYKSKIVLQKYSLNEEMIWVEQIQSQLDTSYNPHSFSLSYDTNIFITAYKEYDYPSSGDGVVFTTTLPYLYMFDKDGNKLWQREFNSTLEIGWFRHKLFTYNNEAFLFNSNDELIKVDLDNNLSLYETPLIFDGISDIQLTKDSNLLITASNKYRLTKTNLNGFIMWSSDYETNLPSNITGDKIMASIQDSSGNIYVTGKHYSLKENSTDPLDVDILTIKYDKNGNQIWKKRYKDGFNKTEVGTTLFLKNDYLYVGGYSQDSNLNYLVLKIDPDFGELNGFYSYNGVENRRDILTSLHIFDNNNVAITGISSKNSNYKWITQLISEVVLSFENLHTENDLVIYPNPIIEHKRLTIEGKDLKSYSIISAMGQVVQNGKFNNSDKNEIQLTEMASGVYLMNIKTNVESIIRKIVVR